MLQLPKTHQFVLNDDVSQLATAMQEGEAPYGFNCLGLNALQLAQYLDKPLCLRLLGGQARPSPVKWMGPQASIYTSLSTAEVETHLSYSPLRYPKYDSLETLALVKQECSFLVGCLLPLCFFWKQRMHKKRYLPLIHQGSVADMTVRWVNDEMGYGLFTNQVLKEGDFIGEYVGKVREMQRSNPDPNPYCFHYPTRWLSRRLFCIDSQKEGNITRFINHSKNPNLTMDYIVESGFLRLFLLAKQEIPRGLQLTFDYGDSYWPNE